MADVTLRRKKEYAQSFRRRLGAFGYFLKRRAGRRRSRLLAWLRRDNMARRANCHGEFLAFSNVSRIIGARGRHKAERRDQNEDRADETLLARSIFSNALHCFFLLADMAASPK
jgi:hypothetical protein